MFNHFRRTASAAAVLLALAAIAPARGQTAAPPLIRAAQGPSMMLRGPFDFCAEHFSVHLEADETIGWQSDAQGNPAYTILSKGRRVLAWSWLGKAIPEDFARFELPNSPVSQRRVITLIPAAADDTGAATKKHAAPVGVYSVVYLLHGAALREKPLQLTMFAGSPDAEIEVASRIVPGDLADRGCVLTRTDPAQASHIEGPK